MAKNLSTEWVSVRRQGPLVFVLKYGVLGWGLCFGGIFWLFVRFVEPRIISTKFTFALFGLSLLSGLIVGVYLWCRLEHTFKKSNRPA